MKKIITVGVAISVCIGAYFMFFKNDSEVKFYEKHEEAAKVEAAQKSKLKKLNELVGQESTLYTQIIEGGKDNNQDALPLIGEAKKTIKEADSIVKTGKESVKEAYATAKKGNKSIRRISDEKAQAQAKKIASLYEKRYKLYNEMASLYENALQEESSLYEALSQSNTDLKAISNRVSNLSVIYEKLNKVNKSFNDVTKQYNDEKVNFYTKVVS